MMFQLNPRIGQTSIFHVTPCEIPTDDTIFAALNILLPHPDLTVVDESFPNSPFLQKALSIPLFFIQWPTSNP